MMRNKLATVIALALVMSVTLSGQTCGDSFDKIKKQLTEAPCTSLRFMSILTSTVFKSEDTSRGVAQMARDGRFSVSLGSDVYICDGKSVYSYSASTNQVIVEPADSAHVSHKEVSFLTRLDDFYQTRVVTPDREYLLTLKKKGRVGNLPDSMTVWIDAGHRRIERVEYLDVNEEPVKLIVQ